MTAWPQRQRKGLALVLGAALYLGAVLPASLAFGRPSRECCPPTPTDCATTPSTVPDTMPPDGQPPALAFQTADERFGGRSAIAYPMAPGGYIDSAIPKSMFRLRFDAGFDMNRPDRAQFFYATWRELSFHPHGINNGGVFFDPNARGPIQLPQHIDYQEASSYIEYAPNSWLSGFVDMPYRSVHFRNIQEETHGIRGSGPGGGFGQQNGQGSQEQGFPEPPNEDALAGSDNPDGISDLQFGFKAALLAANDQREYLTFQFRTYCPTGDAGHGLGTGHFSLEPGLLYYNQPTERFSFQAQLKDWIPIQGGPADGNVLIYGVGVGYDICQRGNLRVTPVAEVVGWSVLSGFQSFFGKVTATPPPGVRIPTDHGVESAESTIVNAKLGVRTYFRHQQDIYIGYGQSLTGDRWYKEIARVEYRIGF